MNRDEILNTLNKYDLDTSSFIIISGSAMVLYGFKDETDDIDIAVTKDYYDRLFTTFNPTLEKHFEDRNDAYMIDGIINFSTNFYSEDSVQISNYRVQTIEELIKLKEGLNREKDKLELKLIRGINEKY